ncbi:MAG: hypothetical protein KAX20_03050 [Candidatus Omnitrophica bacterium]|nr:hypothetical protein [Candidatus Omnitrophota bacterium]
MIYEIKPAHSKKIWKFIMDFRKSTPTLHRKVGSYGLERLLSGFPHLKLKKGLRPGGVYFGDNYGGKIVPFISSKGKKYTPKMKELKEIFKYGRDMLPYWFPSEKQKRKEVTRFYRHFTINLTPEGYFEFAIFVIEMWNTAAYWHSSEWLHSALIYSKDSFLKHMKHLKSEKKTEILSRFDHSCPTINMKKGRGAWVNFLVFSMVHTRRIYRMHCDISPWNFPMYTVSTISKFGPGICF